MFSKQFFLKSSRYLVTLSVVALSLVAGYRLWVHYQIEPWTPDGRVRADIVKIAPDVSGLVTKVFVTNDQLVHSGQPLFQVDPDRYVLALRQAAAEIMARQAALDQARRDASRAQALGEMVSKEDREESRSKQTQAEAALTQALVARDLAVLDVDRTLVKAPVDGVLSDLGLRIGNYVTAGRPVMALIDANSYRVEGYFEETKLSRISIGQPAEVRLMGESRVLKGHVQSIATGIEDRDRAASDNLLPNVNPTSSWVRLAQRVPVRISLDALPDPITDLVVGRTATVVVLDDAQRP
ncbi:efflux RND transporter periplasmic adaptor subunit [Imhoffiella purpurea]|uniref:Secretion protein HlyD n=1 Tax=Imhoffiella purpurea TaxID=1249627 RepID=W9V8K9_9GAMM|nr:HlyD family secretion protein [Imhoffiella purpurea]EXJ13216.1 Secretion protein HlyD [Imhoffiella purpurea]